MWDMHKQSLCFRELIPVATCLMCRWTIPAYENSCRWYTMWSIGCTTPQFVHSISSASFLLLYITLYLTLHLIFYFSGAFSLFFYSIAKLSSSLSHFLSFTLTISLSQIINLSSIITLLPSSKFSLFVSCHLYLILWIWLLQERLTERRLQ